MWGHGKFETGEAPGPPAPFIVGVARSGTTLLRLLLDAHPQLAIPPETYVGSVVRRLAGTDAGPEALRDALVAVPTWADLGIGADELESAFARLPAWSVADGLRAVFRLYAERQGKPRWGDKTPSNGLHLDLLGPLLPEARFVHIIRDVRDVACSLRGLPFAPGDGGVGAVAMQWRRQILATRRLGARLGGDRYLEVRYEQLVATPRSVLEAVCRFIDLAFDEAMLTAHERARERLEELRPVSRDGGLVRDADARRALHRHTLRPPDPQRAGRWRTDLAARELRRVETLAADLMLQLGYAPATSPSRARRLSAAWARRYRR